MLSSYKAKRRAQLSPKGSQLSPATIQLSDFSSLTKLNIDFLLS